MSRLYLFLHKLDYLVGMAVRITLNTNALCLSSLQLLSPDTRHLEALGPLGVACAGHGDVEVQQHPGGECPQHQDAEHCVAVYVAVHNTKHDAVLPSLKCRNEVFKLTQLYS